MERESNQTKAVTFGRVWFWVTQVTSIVGLISIIEDLRLWARALSSIVDLIRSLWQPLVTMVIWLGSLVHAVVEAFRDLFRPILQYVIDWLGFEVPDIAKDALVVALFVALGVRRTKNKYLAEWSELNEHEMQLLAAEASAFGIHAEADARNRLSHALFHYRLLHGKYPLQNEELRAPVEKRWQESLTEFGPNLQAYADSKVKVRSSEQMSDIFARETKAVMIVCMCGGFTLALVALDYFMFKS